jgi:hypothetical protein
VKTGRFPALLSVKMVSLFVLLKLARITAMPQEEYAEAI